ncbi:MAG TPA: carotenoid 1,2-hydratase [Burkholderiales bacterium]|nr:carotenoid 1,2-hydratase [Burkholderiales bacterium]
MSRRQVLLLLGGALCAPVNLGRATSNEQRATSFAPVVPGYKIQFPRDEGSHPDFRIEWWYVTGWLTEPARPLGFQITFFRVRPDLKHDNPSRFAPRQILIAHAALSDPSHGRLIHEQRAARAGFELAGSREGWTRVWIDEWQLLQAGSSYQARIAARDFSLDLTFAATQPPLLQGDNGFSRKGPARESASYYYSIPHLKVGGTVTRGGNARRVTGTAWMDHEWSSQYLEQEAVGWDWVGINLDDGSALMAFRMRGRQGGHFWAGGTLRHADGRLTVFTPDDVRFVPRRNWKSARTGTTYPVSLLVTAGDREFSIEPIFDDQEHDTRATSGTIYWEGAVRAFQSGRPAGLGYLELTGYWRRVNL